MCMFIYPVVYLAICLICYLLYYMFTSQWEVKRIITVKHGNGIKLSTYSYTVIATHKPVAISLAKYIKYDDLAMFSL